MNLHNLHFGIGDAHAFVPFLQTLYRLKTAFDLVPPLNSLHERPVQRY